MASGASRYSGGWEREDLAQTRSATRFALSRWTPRMTAWACGALVVVAGVGIAIYLAVRPPAQARVSVDALPVVRGAHVMASYLDCSKISSVAYFADNPCETFVLLAGDHFRSDTALLSAQTRRMGAVGWRNSAPQPTDFDGAGPMASVNASWAAPGDRACAYLATARDGAAAEAKGLFPYDPYNQPRGVLDFYRKATAADGTAALWVRLRPPNTGGHCVD